MKSLQMIALRKVIAPAHPLMLLVELSNGNTYTLLGTGTGFAHGVLGMALTPAWDAANPETVARLNAVGATYAGWLNGGPCPLAA